MTSQTCHYCGIGVRPIGIDEGPRDVAFNWDHIVPKSWGGTRKVRSCAPCNSAKGNKAPTCRCAGCTDAVERWIFKVLAQARRKDNPVVLHRRVHTLVTHYVLEGKCPSKEVVWWVTSGGNQAITIVPQWEGDDVLVWVRRTEPTRMPMSVWERIREMAEEERRPLVSLWRAA